MLALLRTCTCINCNIIQVGLCTHVVCLCNNCMCTCSMHVYKSISIGDTFVRGHMFVQIILREAIHSYSSTSDRPSNEIALLNAMSKYYPR